MALLKRSTTGIFFNKKGSVIELFDNNMDLVKDIVSTIDKINSRFVM